MYLDLRKLRGVGSVSSKSIAIVDRINPTITIQKEIPSPVISVDILVAPYCYATVITSKLRHPKPRSTV